MFPDGTRELVPIEQTSVDVSDEFWTPRLETLREVTIDTVYGKLETTGRLDNFRIAAGRLDGEYTPPPYNDASVYKWLEAASALLADDDPDSQLIERVEEVIELIAAAQEESGYVNTYFTVNEPDKKWTNLHWMHELYNAGHLIEAAVTHHQTTGEESLLDVGCDVADAIADEFGPGGNQGYPGHPEVELALMRLYRETGVDRYLQTARFFIDQRGRDPSPYAAEIANDDERANGVYHRVVNDDGEYYRSHLLQDHTPVRQQTTVEGHSVRAMYLYSGMTDIAMETGDEELTNALRRLWKNMTTKRMYVTGGIGSTHEGERFTEDYDLPNETAYAETCAAVGNIFWNHRLLQLTGEGAFGDTIERALFNGFLAGVSLEGDRFFYANTLEFDGEKHGIHDVDPDRYRGERQAWYDTSCCPTNASRLLASLGGYIYLRNADEDEICVNLYISSEVETSITGQELRLTQETAYPWDGTVSIRVDVDEPTEFSLSFRIPSWCQSHTLRVNGESADTAQTDGFVSVTRTWRRDDRIEIELDMSIEQLISHPAVAENFRRVSLQRGPLVYCLEGIDNDRQLGHIVLPEDGDMVATFDSTLLGGMTKIEGDAHAPDRSSWAGTLYQPASDVEWTSTRFTAIPYFAWANRDRSEMRVWIHSEDADS